MSEGIDNKPKDAFEAAIDAATGYKPGDENGGAEGAVAQPGTTSVQQQDVGKAEKAKEKRDWVNEAYECFIKNAVDLEPTNPKAAVWEYFKKNATDELKAKVEAEGKTGESCWKFVEAVAKKALHGRSGHIDPVAIYAIAMHYFQDVPKNWDNAEAKTAKVEGQTEKNGHRSNDPKDVAAARRSQIIAHKRRMKDPAMKTDKVYADKVAHDLDDLDKKYPVKKAKPKAKKRGGEQGFFFDLMETEPVVGKEDVGMDADAQDGKEAGDAE